MQLGRANQGSLGISASFGRFVEDNVVLAIVVAELEFGQVQRQILAAHLLAGADAPAIA